MEDYKFLFHALQTIMEMSPDLVFIKDTSLIYRAGSMSFAKMVGLDKTEDLIGKTDYDIFPLELAKKYTMDDQILLDNRQSIVNLIEPLPDQNGKTSYSSTSKSIVYDNEGKAIGLCGIARDVTAQMELVAERESSQISRDLFEDVLEADLTENTMLRIEGSLWTNSLKGKKGESFTDAVEFVAQNFIHPKEQEQFIKMYNLEQLVLNYKNGDKEFSHIVYQTTNGNEYKWMELKSRVYYSRVSKTLRLISFLKDYDDVVRDKEEWKHQAETDSLTELYNRNGFMKKVQEVIDLNPGQTHALMFMDLDYFKLINDNFGHSYGDKVLEEVAKKLSLIFKDNIVGRVGGDEFLVFIQNVLSKDDLIEKANSIIRSVPYHQREDDKEIRVTCSIGISIYGCEEKTIKQLYIEADKAMYSAKDKGRNQYDFYEERKG